MQRWLCIGIIWIGGLACTPKQTTDTDRIFRYNEPGGITSLDPAFASNLPNIWGVLQIYNTLVSFDDSLNIQPALAESWEIDSTGTRFLFHMRRNVYFHPDACFGADSTRPCTAYDLAFSLKRLASTGSGAWILSSVQPDAQGNFVAVRDSFTAEIRLKYPYIQFLNLLANPLTSLVPAEAIERYGDDFRSHPVGTGPYFLRAWWEGEKLVLTRFANYWEKGLPKNQGIAVSFLKEKQTAFMLLLQGKLDFISGIDAAYKMQALEYSGELRSEIADWISMQKCNYLNTEYIGFKLDGKGIGTNKWIRKALRACIQYTTLISTVRMSVGKPGVGSFIPEVLRTWEPVHYVDSFAYYIQKSGYASASEVPPFTVYLDQAYRDLATVLNRQWAQAGFRVKVEILDRPTLKSQVAKGNLEVFRGSWIADYPDPENYFALFYSGNFAPEGPNYTHFSNASYDAWFEACRVTVNDSVRAGYYRKMDSLLIEECPVIPLYYDEVVRFQRKGINGLAPNPLNYLYAKDIELP